MAPDSTNKRYDAKHEECASLPKIRTLHHRLDCQSQDKDTCVARCSNEAESWINSYLATVEPGYRSRRVLKTEQEQKDANQRDRRLLDQYEKSNTQMTKTHGEVSSNE